MSSLQNIQYPCRARLPRLCLLTTTPNAKRIQMRGRPPNSWLARAWAAHCAPSIDARRGEHGSRVSDSCEDGEALSSVLDQRLDTVQSETEKRGERGRGYGSTGSVYTVRHRLYRSLFLYYCRSNLRNMRYLLPHPCAEIRRPQADRIAWQRLQASKTLTRPSSSLHARGARYRLRRRCARECGRGSSRGALSAYHQAQSCSCPATRRGHDG